MHHWSYNLVENLISVSLTSGNITPTHVSTVKCLSIRTKKVLVNHQAPQAMRGWPTEVCEWGDGRFSLPSLIRFPQFAATGWNKFDVWCQALWLPDLLPSEQRESKLTEEIEVVFLPSSVLRPRLQGYQETIVDRYVDRYVWIDV
jgi:hypothetical protein